MEGYIYKTENLITHEVYIGKKSLSHFCPTYHGSGTEIKNSMNKYGSENFETTMICEVENSDELNELEKSYIKEYKEKYGSRCINIAEGGNGGDTFKYASDSKKEEFKKTMTDINRERCQSEEFKRQASIRTKERYKDPEKRKEQSEKVKKAWSDPELIQQQSERLKAYYSTHEKDMSMMNKRCSMELNGEYLEFESCKALKAYLREVYGVAFCNPDLKIMLDSGTPYTPFHKNKMGKLAGMILHYI